MSSSRLIARAACGIVVLFASSAALAAGATQTGADSGAQTQKVVCRDIHTPTSRIVSHVCNSPAEWARLAREQKNSPALNIAVDTSNSARFWVLSQTGAP
jgi:hypothetical protein